MVDHAGSEHVYKAVYRALRLSRRACPQRCGNRLESWLRNWKSADGASISGKQLVNPFIASRGTIIASRGIDL